MSGSQSPIRPVDQPFADPTESRGIGGAEQQTSLRANRPPMPELVKIPAFAAHSWLVSAFSTRQGGLSSAYVAAGPGEQNLGFTPEDDPVAVLAARRRLIETLVTPREVSVPLPDFVTIRQCHSGIARRVSRADLPLTDSDGKAMLEGDALYTQDSCLMLGILTADCVPVLVADTRTRAVAAFHAGWRGTLARIVEHGINALCSDCGSKPQDLIAAIGPSIGPCCFAVGEDVREQFKGEFTYASSLFSEVRSGLRMDLWKANYLQLLNAGVPASAITTVGECTVCTRLSDGRRKYFSYRAEKGITGRMLSVIGTIPSSNE